MHLADLGEVVLNVGILFGNRRKVAGVGEDDPFVDFLGGLGHGEQIRGRIILGVHVQDSQGVRHLGQEQQLRHLCSGLLTHFGKGRRKPRILIFAGGIHQDQAHHFLRVTNGIGPHVGAAQGVAYQNVGPFDAPSVSRVWSSSRVFWTVSGLGPRSLQPRPARS